MNKDFKGDIILSFAAFFQVAVLLSQLILIDTKTFAHESIKQISIIISAIPMVFATYYIIRRNLWILIATYFSVLLIIILTLIFFPANKIYLLDNLFYLLCINIPCFLCVASIRSISVLRRIMHILSFIIFALGLVYMFLLGIGKIIFSLYSMPFSNYLLLPALVFITQRRVIYFIFFIVICIMMLIIGSRGALVAAILYTLSILYFDKFKSGSLIFLLLLLIVFSATLFEAIITLTEEVGISSRTIHLFTQGNITQSSARSEIYSVTWASVLKGPLLGHGIYGDRVILGGEYCHNIILELLHNFGILPGSVIVIAIFIFTIHTLLRSNKENKKFLVMILCYSIIPLMVSGSYLNDSKFGLFLGSLALLSTTTQEPNNE